ncbi:extracellular solute-binding protein [Phytoactinopolyspora sp. XMNu-373]|uniref:Probable sugar-binding periplasmic protein n=2 Tax=Phytoactinopolyspora mesophila TaxID=2650750 RepID=A0A7K3LZN9_9ACTN|nr:extracellular solute-binding protein [Phytoactinopolyspora mesophila]
MHRRDLLRLLGIAGLGSLGVSCAGPGSTTNSDDAAPEEGDVSGAISFAHWRAEDSDVFDEIISDFAAEHDDVSVRQDISPSNDYQSTALQRVRSAAIGDAFTAFRGAQFVDMASAGLFADLSEQPFAQNYQADLITAGQSDGRQLGFPYQLVFNMPVFNVDAFEDAGISEPPADWDGFLDLLDKLASAGYTPMAWPGGEPGNAGQLINSMVMNNAPSEDMFTGMEQGEFDATDDWFVTTLKQYAELRPFFQNNASGTAVEPAQQMFAEGEAAILATGSYHIAAIRDLGAEFPMDLISPITVGADEVQFRGVHNATFILGVNTASDNQATATAFVEYLSRPEVAAVYADGTGQHVTVEGVEYTSPDLQALAHWLDQPTILAPRFQFNDLDMRSAIEDAAIQVVGGKDPEQAAADAQRIVEQRRA